MAVDPERKGECNLIMNYELRIMKKRVARVSRVKELKEANPTNSIYSINFYQWRFYGKI